MNVSEEASANVSRQNFLSIEASQFFFTPTLVNTGLNAEATTAALASADYTPDQVDIVVLTHMHGNHIGRMMTFLGDGDDVVTGITGMAAFDHTPYRIESEGLGLVIFADLANHPVWSLARPEWRVRFGADKEQAAMCWR